MPDSSRMLPPVSSPELTPVRAHDLLWIAHAHDLTFTRPAPAWATAAWLEQMPVVVRREATTDDAFIPVGIRGRARSERMAGYVRRDRVVRRMTPEAVADTPLQTWPALDPERACLRTLERLRPGLAALGLDWGVTGSAGFALATGVDVLKSTSDLDLLVRAPRTPSAAFKSALSALLADQPARVDVQIDTGLGGFAFNEWLAARGAVLLKTDRGPVLVADPWDIHAIDRAHATQASAHGSSPLIHSEPRS
jgi:phosphoribosyl-dephospho-CoA transferase